MSYAQMSRIVTFFSSLSHLMAFHSRVSRAVQTKEGAPTCVRTKFGNISAVAALLWDSKPSAGELSSRSSPLAALQLAAACSAVGTSLEHGYFFYVL